MISAPQLEAAFRRFIKGFVAGGIAQVVLIIGPGLHFANMAEFRAVMTSLVFGFLVGGLLGIQKMYSWEEPPAPTIDSLPDVK